MKNETVVKGLTIVGVLGVCAVAWAANCNIDVPATCHYASTNLDSGGHIIVTSDGFSTKCVSTNASGGMLATA